MAEIYALEDPRDETIHYIGRANGNGGAISRFTWHLDQAMKYSKKDAKAHWLRDLIANDRLPTLVMLETVVGDGVLRELQWIHYGVEEGWPLTNVVGTPWQVSEDGRFERSQRLKGRKLAPETIEKMRAAMTGRKLSAEHRQAISFGLRDVVRTPEHNAKIGEANRGNPHPQKKLQCECGTASTGSGMARHRKATGHSLAT